MEVIKTEIEGVVIIEPRIFKDARGYFFESFSQREFDEKVGHVEFVQDNESMSSYGVMRGLHFQRPPFTQAKLVRCVRGKVLGRGRGHQERLAHLRAARGRGIDRGQPPAVLHPERLRPWIRRAERDGGVPVQVRRVLPSRSGRGHQHP